jgi:hypothetical protein
VDEIRPWAARFQTIYITYSNFHGIFSIPHSLIDIVAWFGEEFFDEKIQSSHRKSTYRLFL